MTTDERDATPEGWIYIKNSNEPPFYARNPGANEINGYDPLSGLIIAHSIAECRRLGVHPSLIAEQREIS